MVKRCIGIDIGSSSLRAVQLLRTDGQFRIEKVFSSQTRRSTDSLSNILGSLTSRYGFDRRADVAIAMPHNAVFFRTLETDLAGTEQIRKSTSSALEHDFPIQPDELVAQVCSYRRLSGDKCSVLTAAVPRESLRERLKILGRAKIHPSLIDAAIFAIHSTVEVNHPEIITGTAIIAYIDESYLTLAISRDNNMLIVRNTPVASRSENNTDSLREQLPDLLSREAQITWQKVFGNQIEQGTKIYLVTAGNVSDGLKATIEENLHCQTTIVDPYAKVKCSADHNGDAAICLAEGLALRASAPEQTTGINFLEADSANIKPALNPKKEFVICTILLAAIAVVSLVGLFIRLSHLETKYARIKNEIGETFQRALPEEINIVNPLAQLEQKLQSLRTDYAFFGSISGVGIGPLEVLHAITTSFPPETNISINDMLITPESVRLTGTSQSFESVYDWQRLLHETPQFLTVDVLNIGRETDSERIHFTILMSLATPE